MLKLAAFADATGALASQDTLSITYFDAFRGSGGAAFSLDVGARVPIYESAIRNTHLWGLTEREMKFPLHAVRKRIGAEWTEVTSQSQNGRTRVRWTRRK